MKNYLILLVLACITACTHTEKSTDSEASSLIYMKIEKPNMSSLQPLRLSEFADSVEYLQLETNSKCLISYPYPIKRAGNKLFLRSGGDIFQFDMTGKFICQIGRTGQGPGEFSMPNFDIDEVNGKVFIRSASAKSPMSFDFEGNYLGNLKDSLLLSCWGVLAQFGSGTGYLIYANELVNAANQWACQPYELMVYDYINHRMIQGLTNTMVCQHTTHGHHIQPGLRMLSKQGDTHYYKTFYNDTLYAVNGEGIFPSAIIDLGSRKYPADLVFATTSDPPLGRVGKIVIVDTYIGHNYLLIECMLINNENLRNSDPFICKYNRKTGDLTYHPYFIINDIDGGHYATVSTLRSSIRIVPFEDEKTKQKENIPDKATLKYPELKEKFELMQKNRDEDDNPILMTLKIKEL